jgi:hypothetical protein
MVDFCQIIYKNFYKLTFKFSLGTAIARSETKYYGVVVFVKRLIGRSIFTDLTVFYDADLSQMVPHLQDYQFDQFIADHRHLFSTEFGLKYNGFTKQLGQKNAHKLIIRLFENKITVHIASITPVWADKFFADLQREEHHAPAQQQPQIKCVCEFNSYQYNFI